MNNFNRNSLIRDIYLRLSIKSYFKFYAISKTRVLYILLTHLFRKKIIMYESKNIKVIYLEKSDILFLYKKTNEFYKVKYERPEYTH